MTELIVPAIDRRPWPSLGGPICDFIRDNLVFGPGDRLGEPVELDDETEWLIWRLYEVFPHDHPQAGRRRFKRVALSLRKGTAKTEKAAWITAVELHPEGPVRCDGWRRQGRGWIPVGAPVTDPYIPMVAYTEEQSEDLAYGALKALLERSPLAGDFDITDTYIRRLDGAGEAVPLASAPSSRDGARTTFEHFDETHHFTLPRLRDAHHTMILNLPKRFRADAWALETTTAPVPGDGSVAEGTMDYARQVASGAISDSRLFFFHRQASDHHDLSQPEGLRAAVLEASGPYAAWSDIDNIVALWQDPSADRAMLQQRWLNRLVQGTARAFDMEAWRRSDKPGHPVPKKAPITLGFDGSRTRDASALIATEIATGYQWPLGIWYPDPATGEIDVGLVEVAVDDAFTTYAVWRLYADPWRWELYVRSWAAKYGKDQVVEFWTNQHTRMARAVRNYANAIAMGEVPHVPGEPAGSIEALFTEHLGNARIRKLVERDEEGERLWVIEKERADSPHKMDGAMGGCLSWEARTHALAAGMAIPPKPSVYDTRGITFIGG